MQDIVKARDDLMDDLTEGGMYFEFDEDEPLFAVAQWLRTLGFKRTGYDRAQHFEIQSPPIPSEVIELLEKGIAIEREREKKRADENEFNLAFNDGVWLDFAERDFGRGALETYGPIDRPYDGGGTERLTLCWYPNDIWLMRAVVTDTSERETSETISDLSKKEAAEILVRSRLKLSATKLYWIQEALRGREPESQAEPIEWRSATGELLVGGHVVRTYAATATSCRPILDKFEAEGWPKRIDSPFQSEDPEKLREAIRSLNQKLNRKILRFAADGSGKGVSWSRKSQ